MENNIYLRNFYKKWLFYFLLFGLLNVERMKLEGMVLFLCRDDCIVFVIFVLICLKLIDIDNDVLMM